MRLFKSHPFFRNGKPIRRAPSPAGGAPAESSSTAAAPREPRTRSLRHRAPLLWLLLPFLLGLVLGRCLPIPTFSPLWLLAAGTACALPACLCSHRTLLWAGSLSLSLVLLGAGWYLLRRGRLAAWENLPPREASLTVRVERIFSPQPGARSFSGLGRITATDTLLRDLIGQRVYFSVLRPAGGELPVRSAEIGLTGVLQVQPRSAPDDTFDGYLANLGINFRLGRARLTAWVRPPTAYRAFCERTAARMTALLGEGVEAKRPALTAILRAMMLGQKQDLTPEQGALFMHSGTMHLFAINGLHIGVVAASLHLFLALLRVPRLAASLLTLAVLWLDVDTTGGSPSAVRAFLLVASVEVAFGLRRPASGLAALGNAALLVLVLDPLALFSASFQMSYGVALAILSLGLPLSERLQRRWKPFARLPKVSWTRRHHAVTHALDWLAGALAIGIAATLVSLVSGVQFFHVFVPGSLLSNLVLVPLAAMVISAGFISVAGGLLGLVGVSFWFNHAAVLLLCVIDALIRFSSGLSGTWCAAVWRQPWIGPVALAGLLALCLAGYASGWRLKRGSFWTPVAWVALVLVFGVKFG